MPQRFGAPSVACVPPFGLCGRGFPHQLRPFNFTVVFYAPAMKSYVLTVKSTHNVWEPPYVQQLGAVPAAGTAPSLNKVRVFEPLNEPEPLT